MTGTCDATCESKKYVCDYDATCTSTYCAVICCDSSYAEAPPPGRIFACNSDVNREAKLDRTNKLIYNLVRTPASLYMNNLGAVVVSRDILYNITNSSSKFYFGQAGTSQQSDRAKLSGSLRFNRLVPSRGNSTKRSKTSMRPGTQSPGGIGVDVKHNSYQRYLLKKKGLHALQGSAALGNHNTKIQNNKYRKGPVIAGCSRTSI